MNMINETGGINYEALHLDGVKEIYTLQTLEKRIKYWNLLGTNAAIAFAKTWMQGVHYQDDPFTGSIRIAYNGKQIFILTMEGNLELKRPA